MKKLASALTLSLVLITSALSAAEEERQRDTVLIHLSSYTDNLHAVSMALKIGQLLSKEDMSVTLFLDLEGVRLVDKNQPQNISWGTGDTIDELYNSYVSVGGAVLVCPHCAEAAGVIALREGAVMANQQKLLMAIKNADKILDY